MNKTLQTSASILCAMRARQPSGKTCGLPRARPARPTAHRLVRWPIIAVLLTGVVAAPRAALGQIGGRVTSEQVAAAVQRGLAYLRQRQGGDGNWSGGGYPGGITALCLLAMLNSGVSTDDPAVVRGLAALERIPNVHTYVVSLKCQVYAAAGPKKYARQLQTAATWLAQAQLASGMWNYGHHGRGDNSNTQFALLGLHEAANAGAAIPAEVWVRSARHFLNTQCPDGGWSYTTGRRGYGSMTTAGLASLYICGQRLHVGGPKVFRHGAYPDCGKYTQNVAIASGLRWLTDNFSVRTNPNRGTWLHYYLYGLERVGMISGRRNFGVHDWYREGAEFLVGTQNAHGSWGRQDYVTAFGILFLAKGNRPVLVQKVQWNGDWNRNIHDLEYLTEFLGDKLGKPVTWQTARLNMPLEELRAGPMLFLTGHAFPNLTDDEKQMLRKFVESGGVLLAEACCGSKGFREGFRDFAAQVFPAYPLHPLPPNHPVFAAHYAIKDTYALEGINVGCRTGVIFSPNALSCLWELKDIPDWSEKAFRLGTNIAAYAAGSQPLPDKLDAVELRVVGHAAQPIEVPRGAVQIARLVHKGDYSPDPHAMVNLAAMLRDMAKVDVVAQARHLQATDEEIYEYPVIFIHGHFAFKFSEEQIKALRLYLSRGGFLFADACCGREEFDKSFREMVKQLFPNEPLEPLPKDHPIYTGQVGLPLGQLRYRQILAKELNSPGTSYPPLEALKLNGRTAMIYSKYDFSCALEGDNPYSCRGYVDKDGQRLAMNIVLYGISY